MALANALEIRGTRSRATNLQLNSIRGGRPRRSLHYLEFQAVVRGSASRDRALEDAAAEEATREGGSASQPVRCGTSRDWRGGVQLR
jgi:hypothetical protein